MAVLDLAAYKPVPATLGDANQIANGFAAIQTVVNALDNNNFAAGLIFDPAKIMQSAAIDGDSLAWDNSLVKWKPASLMAAGRPRPPRVVTSTMAGGPPSSPVDQDIWVATAVDANGTRWAFQYNAGSASAFKWEFIGGSAVYAGVETLETTASGGFAALATAGPAITVARQGDYIVSHGFSANTANATNELMSYDVGGTGAVDIDAAWAGVGGGEGMSVSRARLRTALAAATTLTAKYRSSAAVVAGFQERWMQVLPERII